MIDNHFTRDSKCTDITCDSIITLEEKRSKYIGCNDSNKPFIRIKIDNCFINAASEKKCDYLLIDYGGQIAYFVELKGVDILGAVEQIESTIDRLLIYLKDHVINARIVLTKVNVHDLRASKYIRFENKIKKLKGIVIKKSKIIEETI